MKARALFFEAAGRVGLGEFELPAPGPGQIVVETAFSCVSPGTELRCLAGRQRGAAFPFVPGYSLSGRVAAAGAGVALAAGTPVYCRGTIAAGRLARAWGGHVSHALADAGAVIPLAPGADLLEASAAALAAIAHRGVAQARPRPGETALVAGLGAIGQFSARLLANAGASVVACDLSTARCALAAAMPGVAVAVARGGDLEAAVRPLLPDGADLVVDATGAASAATRAMALLRVPPWDEVERPLPRFVVQGSYAGDLALDYATVFAREARVLVPRNRKRADEQAVLDLLASGRLPARDLLGEPARPADAPAVYAGLAGLASGRVAAVFDWGAAR